MSSQAFFWLNSSLAVGLLLLFAIRRGQRQPTRLNFRGNRSNKDSRKEIGAQVLSISPETRAAQAMHGGVGVRPEKNLNVLFNYNGHTWDAFEILGLPAGASAQAVDEAYKRELANCSQSGREFIDTAYQALSSRSRLG